MPQDLSWLPDKPANEAPFRQWYAAQSKRYGLNPNPDAPEQLYDYRAAFKAGATPDASGHWPSTFKQPGHPNEIVGGFNTRTGERVPGVPQASESELVRLGWEPETAKRLSAAKPDLSWLPDKPNHRQPASAEQFMTPEDIANRDMTATDLGIGALKAVGRSAVGLSKLAAMPGKLVGGQGADHPIFQRLDAALKSSNSAQDVGGYMETAAEVAVPVVRGATALAKYVPGAARQAIVSGAKAMADERPLLTQVRQKVAQKVLARVLDMTKRPVAGARVVKSSGGSIEDDIASALDELRAPSPAPSVELPPAPRLPPGYAPRTSAPAPSNAPAQAPAPQGRIVPAAPRPNAEQIAADALAETRAAAMPTVTTPPAATLPPGYQPRTSVPRSSRPPSPDASPEPSAQQKRAYFLKSPEEMAARSAPESVAPSGSITIDDLPAAWKSHTGQDLFPNTGAEAREITEAFRQQVKSSGMTVGQAIAAVSKNKDISTQMRTQIIRALSGGAR